MDTLFFTLVFFFLISAAITWIAGITLAKTTDTLDSRFKIGDALGGLILLGISGSLPEIAISFSAARDGHIPIIIGTLLGGIAMQTLIIVFFDLAVKNKKPLSYVAGCPMLALETFLTILVTAIALVATFIPASKNIHNTNPLSFVIIIAWIAGLFIINKARKNPSWNRTAGDAMPGRKHRERRAKQDHPFYANKSTLHIILIFAAASVFTLIAGVVLEKTGSAIASRIGMDSGIFAATFLALVASLPEISTGLESILIGDNQLAVSDIMGGNSFMLTIFFFTDLIAHKPILSYAKQADIFITVLGIVMMTIYAFSFLLKLRHRYFKLGLDSIFEIIIYFSGVYVLTFIR
jgi:cation:H+ antiporter